MRISDLYFDDIDDCEAPLVNRMVRGNTIRVGIRAQGFAFPAPTGW